MPNAMLYERSAGLCVRRSRKADLDALWELENKVFDTDRMSRRSLKRLLRQDTSIKLRKLTSAESRAEALRRMNPAPRRADF